ncbi:MAG: hypothetical protein EAY81_05260 [Bacteroidetes bacterium]|nr:MAG: hypothetical protein EAY81_05260 [Bacteroidota bacterium]
MELKWKTTFFNTKLLDKNEKQICSFDIEDIKSITLLDYQISSAGFHNYYVQDGLNQVIQAHIDTTNLNLIIGADSYEFIYENQQHCYMKWDQTIIANCYKDNGIFNSSGTIIINDNISHRPIFIFALLVLRKIALKAGTD